MSMRATAAEPIVEELSPAPSSVEAFRRLCHLPGCLFLDSARFEPRLGRYSFVAADPFDWLEQQAGRGLGLELLEKKLAVMRAKRMEGLPPFQGGAAGMFGYELGRDWENIPTARFDELRIPALAIGFYDVVVAFDHVDERAWIISQGFPELEPGRRRARATRRLRQFVDLLAAREAGLLSSRSATNQCTETISLAPRFATGRADELTSSFDRDGYLHMVQRAIEYVHAGDIFQVNLAQSLLHPASAEPVQIFLRLRELNAAPFAGYFDAGKFQLASASPERFLAVNDRIVETRPIKGTRARRPWPEADLYTGDELLLSEKDRAENVMIVDLLRNDLSRVCDEDSVCVTQLCELETFAHVQHLVSAVEGRLGAGVSSADLIKATFPGGSITGAPKIRAMEIIAELEKTARGAYCGSLGYIGFSGMVDLSILIRTITIRGGWQQAPVGGGIVAQSDPRREYEETWDKAAGMVEAMTAKS